MKRLLYSLALLPLLVSAHAQAQPDSRIVAVVNDEAITSLDVDTRMKFVFATTKMAGTPDVEARVRPQVVHTLIDEKLQTQEAKKNGLDVTSQDIDNAIAAIEAQRGMPPRNNRENPRKRTCAFEHVP